MRFYVWLITGAILLWGATVTFAGRHSAVITPVCQEALVHEGDIPPLTPFPGNIIDCASVEAP